MKKYFYTTLILAIFILQFLIMYVTPLRALSQCCDCSFVNASYCSLMGCSFAQCGSTCACTHCADPGITGYCFTDADCPSPKTCPQGQGAPSCVVDLCRPPGWVSCNIVDDLNYNACCVSSWHQTECCAYNPTLPQCMPPTPTPPPPYVGRCSTQPTVWQNCGALCTSSANCNVIPSGYSSVACPNCSPGLGGSCSPPSGQTNNCGSNCNSDADCNAIGNVCNKCLPW